MRVVLYTPNKATDPSLHFFTQRHWQAATGWRPLNRCSSEPVSGSRTTTSFARPTWRVHPLTRPTSRAKGTFPSGRPQPKVFDLFLRTTKMVRNQQGAKESMNSGSRKGTFLSGSQESLLLPACNCGCTWQRGPSMKAYLIRMGLWGRGGLEK